MLPSGITARRLAVAAYRVFPTDQALSVMTSLLTEQQQGGMLPSDPASDGVSGVAFSPTGNLLASADRDGTVRLWDPVTGQAPRAPLVASTGVPRGVDGVAFSPDGRLLATADGHGTVETWRISLFVDPFTTLCADVGSPTKADWARYAPGEPQPRICS